MSQPQLRIAIVGAGPAGLTLGLLLHKRGIPYTIFERSHKPTDEELAKPSGSLDLHEESGLSALKACDLYDEFTSYTNDCTEAQKVSNKHGEIIYSDEGELSNRPEISRHKLTKMILKQVPTSTIRWGQKLISAERSSESGKPTIELNFDGTAKQTFDFVVGADGAWSKIRRLLTDVKPHYAGVHNITANIRQITSKHPELADFVGSGSFTSLGDHNGVFSQRSGPDGARIYVMISTKDENFATTNGLSSKTAAQAKDLLIGEGAPLSNWGTNIKELVHTACDDETANDPDTNLDIRPLYSLPVGHSWEHQPGATLIGDASHLMCPWAGEGVNLAMRDSLLLSQAIGQAYEAGAQDATSLQIILDPLIKEFEIKMAELAKIEAEGTQENGEMMFGSADGASAMKKFFESAYPPPQLE